MAIDPGGGSGMGGICSITPSDLAGQVDNLLTRLAALEQTVARLSGGNVEAGQLSNISGQAGWIYGLDYLGTPGWIQTPTGNTLIPPPGVSFSNLGLTLSDGTPWSAIAVTKDDMGVFHYPFGVKPDGTLFGDSVDEWNAAAEITGGTSGLDYANVVYEINNGVSQDTNGITVTTTTDGANPSIWELQVSKSGLYWIYAHGAAFYDGGSHTVGDITAQVVGEDTAEESPAYLYGRGVLGDPTDNERFTASLGRIKRIASDSATIRSNFSIGAPSASVYLHALFVVRVSV